MADDHERQLRHELVRLRRGWGLQASGLRSRLGPRLLAAGGIVDRDDDRVIAEKLSTVIRQLTGGFPRELRLAALAALGIDDKVWFPTLTKRLGWLAGELKCSERNARRRADEACERLALELRRRLAGADAPDPERDWRLSRLSALLCLDRPAPELYEERTIVATRDGLAEIQTRVSLPLPAEGDRGDAELVTKVLFGARLRGQEVMGDQHYRHTLTLPRPMRYGDELQYKIAYVIPPRRMLPHYAFVPLIPCDVFQVRVRFDPGRPPREVWRLERTAPRLLDSPHPSGQRLIPDAAGDISLSFTNLVPGLGYGVGWRLQDGPAPA